METRLGVTVALSPITAEQRSHGDTTASKKKQWHRRRTLWDRIDRRPTARTLSMLNTNAVARRCHGVLKERSGVAVLAP